MRIFVAGATGVLGIRVVPLLVAAGHDVWGLTRTLVKVDLLRAAGAEPVVCDIYDLPTLREEVATARPEAILHLLTDLPDTPTWSDEVVAANARIRREGTANLLTAARAAGTSRILAESVAWTLPGAGGRAAAELERAVLNVAGVVLRYGRFYGEGTWHAGADLPDPPRVHVDEAARRTVETLEARSGIVEIVERPIR